MPGQPMHPDNPQAVAAPPERSLWLDAAGRVTTLDQTVLPFEKRTLTLASIDDCVRAIATMQVRGAPLIGAVAAYGLALSLRRAAADEDIVKACSTLAATRPTAVNLRWALERVRRRVEPLAPSFRAAAAWDEAARLCDEDVAANRAIGEHALALWRPMIVPGRPLRILTHCNAGRLAAIAYGTALAPIHLARERGIDVHVWVDETRPRNQGAALTAWELAEAGIAHTVIADNAGGLLMQRGEVDVVIVGCDRVAANGDVVNKVGTYLKALAAGDNGVPFHVACPLSTLDRTTPDGASVPIEERAAREVSHITGRTEAGAIVEVRLVPEASAAANPAFDVTPARLVSALITEAGVCAADAAAIAALP